MATVELCLLRHQHSSCLFLLLFLSGGRRNFEIAPPTAPTVLLLMSQPLPTRLPAPDFQYAFEVDGSDAEDTCSHKA